MKKLHNILGIGIVVICISICIAALVTAPTQRKTVPEEITEEPEETVAVTTAPDFAPVVIASIIPSPDPSPIPALDFTTDEETILLHTAMSEAEGESTEGKAAVMCVVLNRVRSADFPDTIREVVFQKNQFSTTVTGGRYWTTTPNEDCYAALELVRYGWDDTEGALFFEQHTGKKSWHSEHLEYLFTLGNHSFYK